MRETDLYPPIKRFLEQQGYEVKAEIGAADVVGLRGDEPPLVVETKTGFSLSLFHQGTERQAVTDLVYLAVPLGRGTAWLTPGRSWPTTTTTGFSALGPVFTTSLRNTI